MEMPSIVSKLNSDAGKENTKTGSIESVLYVAADAF